MPTADLQGWLKQAQVHDLDVGAVVSALEAERIFSLSGLADAARDDELCDLLMETIKEQVVSKLAIRRIERALAALQRSQPLGSDEAHRDEAPLRHPSQLGGDQAQSDEAAEHPSPGALATHIQAAARRRQARLVMQAARSAATCLQAAARRRAARTAFRNARLQVELEKRAQRRRQMLVPTDQLQLPSPAELAPIRARHAAATIIQRVWCFKAAGWCRNAAPPSRRISSHIRNGAIRMLAAIASGEPLRGLAAAPTGRELYTEIRELSERPPGVGHGRMQRHAGSYPSRPSSFLFRKRAGWNMPALRKQVNVARLDALDALLADRSQDVTPEMRIEMRRRIARFSILGDSITQSLPPPPPAPPAAASSDAGSECSGVHDHATSVRGEPSLPPTRAPITASVRSTRTTPTTTASAIPPPPPSTSTIQDPTSPASPHGVGVPVPPPLTRTQKKRAAKKRAAEKKAAEIIAAADDGNNDEEYLEEGDLDHVYLKDLPPDSTDWAAYAMRARTTLGGLDDDDYDEPDYHASAMMAIYGMRDGPFDGLTPSMSGAGF